MVDLTDCAGKELAKASHESGQSQDHQDEDAQCERFYKIFKHFHHGNAFPFCCEQAVASALASR